MKKTKKKIILSALELFNADSLFNVRNQDIANTAGMSLSNFNYHYKNKDELVSAVFGHFLDSINSDVYNNNKHIVDGNGLGLLVSYLRFQEKYKFFYLDSFNIMSTYPKIKSDFLEKVSEALTIIKNILYMGVGKGYFKPFPDDGGETISELVHLLWCNNHFLLQNMRVWNDESNYVIKGIKSSALIIYPYMTEFGAGELREVVSILESKGVS